MPKYKYLNLNKGFKTLVDYSYFKMFSTIHFYFHKSSGYAVTKIWGKDICLHHFILPPKRGLEVDHINRNRLDNRVCNLRYLTKSENRFNHGTQKNNRSGHRGVFWYKKISRWIVYIGKPRKYLGCYKSKSDAIMVYRKEAIKRWGSIYADNQKQFHFTCKMK